MSNSLRLTVAIGTRPEVVKLAPVVSALRAAGHSIRVIATGQHSDPRLAGDLFRELGCQPDVVWILPEHGESDRVGALLAHSYDEFCIDRPDALMVLGDTSSAPLLALAARRHGIGVIHLEAGLRSFNPRSLEEVNRRSMAALATVHLAPTDLAAGLLEREGVMAARIRVVGNPVIDAIVSSGVVPTSPANRRGVLFTAHRATNVDDAQRLLVLEQILRGLVEDHGLVLFPVHPRTRTRLEAAGLWRGLRDLSGLTMVDPLPYRSLLDRLASSVVCVTDSGGLQEEASYLGVPVVVMRHTTPRWEGVVSGAAELTGVDAPRVLAAARRLAGAHVQRRVSSLSCPYGDGSTGERVCDALADEELLSMLVPVEPELLHAIPAEVAEVMDASKPGFAAFRGVPLGMVERRGVA